MKKILCLLSVIAVLFIFVACESENNNEDESTNYQTTIDDLDQRITELEMVLEEKDEQLSESYETVENLESQLREKESQLQEQESQQQNEESDTEQSMASAVSIEDQAEEVVTALENEDYQSLASYVHPTKGVRFSPYGRVLLNDHIVFQAADVASFAQDTTQYQWGTQDGTGSPITMIPSDYYDDYIYIRDFSNDVDIIAVNDIDDSYGSLIVDVENKYPNADFVSYYVPATNALLDWANLILAFEEHQGEWYLVGLIVDRWTT